MSGPLPIGLISQAIPKLTRHELEAITERLIERLDEMDGDCDLEDSHDQEAIDEREEGFAECLSAYHAIDQRQVVEPRRSGFARVTNTDDFMPRL